MIRVHLRNRAGTLRTDFGARMKAWRLEQYINARALQAMHEALLWGTGVMAIDGFTGFHDQVMGEP